MTIEADEAGTRTAAGSSSVTSRSGHAWRLDVQGVRGVAVTLVVAYHVGLLPGGFVGVDLFFVISGLMITEQMLRRDHGGFAANLGDFYARRIRRIIPVSTLTILATVVAGYAVLGPLEWRELVTDGVWSSLFGMNVHLADMQNDYLRADLPVSALQHYWSLGVEEQFYLVWPVLVFATVARGRRRVIAVAAALMLGSLILLATTPVSDAWRFYGLPTRAWQLLAGSLLGWSRSRRVPGPAIAADIASVTGAAAIALGVVLAGSGALWPGPATVVLTVGALLILWAPPTAMVNRILSHRSLAWIGDRSYAWYLLHFPPLVLIAAGRSEGLPTPLAVFVALVTLAAAHLVYLWIESPMRARRWSTRSTLVIGACSLVLLCTALIAARSVLEPLGRGPEASGLVESVLDQDSARERVLDEAATLAQVPRNLVPSLADARADRPAVYDDGCHAGFGIVAATPCVLVDQPGPTVVLYGDSHAAQWLPALEIVAENEGWRLVSLTKSGCTPAGAETFNASLDRWYTECTRWRRSAHDVIGDLAPDAVIVAGSAEYLTNPRTAARYSVAAWQEAYISQLQAWSAEVGHVVLLEEPTAPSTDVPACLAEHLNDARQCTFDRRNDVSDSYRGLEQRAAAAAGVTLVSSKDLLCGAVRCPVVVGNVLVYRDASHMTTRYASTLAAPLTERLIAGGVLSDP